MEIFAIYVKTLQDTRLLTQDDYLTFVVASFRTAETKLQILTIFACFAKYFSNHTIRLPSTSSF